LQERTIDMENKMQHLRLGRIPATPFLRTTADEIACHWFADRSPASADVDTVYHCMEAILMLVLQEMQEF